MEAQKKRKKSTKYTIHQTDELLIINVLLTWNENICFLMILFDTTMEGNINEKATQQKINRRQMDRNSQNRITWIGNQLKKGAESHSKNKHEIKDEPYLQVSRWRK